MADKKDIKERLTAASGEAARFLKEQPRSRIVQWVTAPAVVAILVMAAVWWSRNTGFRILSPDLQLAETAQVTEELDKEGIRYKFAEGGTTILVPGGDLPRARMVLASKGIASDAPSGDTAIFDNVSPGTPVATQELMRKIYLQKQLERSIKSIQGVSSARVHFTVADDTPFLGERVPAKASVVVGLNRVTVGTFGAKGVAFLVANAIKGLELDQVSILDTDGRVHWPESGDPIGKGFESTVEYRLTHEKQLEQKAIALLGAVVGIENVSAVATILLNTDHWERAEERYGESDPKLRSEQAGSETLRNYEMDRTIEKTRGGSVTIKRLTMGVFINEADGIPLGDAELDRYEQILRDAIGYDEARGDSLTVAAAGFLPPLEVDDIELAGAPGTAIGALADLDPVFLGGVGGAVLVLLGFAFVVGRRGGRSSALAEVDREAPKHEVQAAPSDALRRWVSKDPQRVQQLMKRWNEAS